MRRLPLLLLALLALPAFADNAGDVGMARLVSPAAGEERIGVLAEHLGLDEAPDLAAHLQAHERPVRHLTPRRRPLPPDPVLPRTSPYCKCSSPLVC